MSGPLALMAGSISGTTGGEMGPTRMLVGDMAAFTDGLGCQADEPGIVLGLDALCTLPQVVISTKQKILSVTPLATSS